MSLLVESINIIDGNIYNLPLHEARANASRIELYDEFLQPINLITAINIPEDLRSGQVKCRILYDTEIRSITFKAYQTRVINTVKIIHDDKISYTHKWVQRADLDVLFDRRESADEILIFKNGWLTDAYYYNIVICIDGKYYTPRLPLLKGIRRTQLINGGWILEADIDETLLRQATAVYLVNTLTPLGKISLAAEQIVF